MHENFSKQFDQVVNNRRSVRVYDEENPIDTDAVRRSIARATLAPNSSNMQLWEFYHITSEDLKKKIAFACFEQPTARTASQFVVFVTRHDKWRDRKNYMLEMVKNDKSIDEKRLKQASNYYGKVMPTLYGNDVFGIIGSLKKALVLVTGLFRRVYYQVSNSDLRVVVHKSCALAAQTFMLSIAAEGYDSCPMEGFDSQYVKKALGLPFRSEINMIVSVGRGKPEGIYGPRVRVPQEQVIFER